MCVSVCVCVCVCVCVSVCLCVSVCVRERVRERERPVLFVENALLDPNRPFRVTKVLAHARLHTRSIRERESE
eukprot:COSAG03_NODE_10482_length_648_cov_1.491803_1_plen_73_part_00